MHILFQKNSQIIIKFEIKHFCYILKYYNYMLIIFFEKGNIENLISSKFV